MMIRFAKACVKKAALTTPFAIATGQHNSLNNVFFVIELENGAKGFGEAAVATHITGETVDETLRRLKEAAMVCCGENIADYRLFLYGWREYFNGNHAGLAAFEIAVLDAWARSVGIPLWKMFGSSPSLLQTDITIVIGSLEAAGEAALAFSRQGFKDFKIKIGRDYDLDLKRVLSVARLARRSRIILDANQGFTAKETLSFVHTLLKLNVVPVLVEQPVHRDDWDGLIKVTRLLSRYGVLVCADESVKTLSDAVQAIRLKAVSAINLKLMKSGILEAEAIARLSRAKGLKLMMGAMMESSLAITAAAHLAAGLGFIDFVDLDTTFFLKGPLSRSPYLDRRGRFDLTQAGKGIGVRVSL